MSIPRYSSSALSSDFMLNVAGGLVHVETESIAFNQKLYWPSTLTHKWNLTPFFFSFCSPYISHYRQ